MKSPSWDRLELTCLINKEKASVLHTSVKGLFLGELDRHCLLQIYFKEMYAKFCPPDTPSLYSYFCLLTLVGTERCKGGQNLAPLLCASNEHYFKMQDETCLDKIIKAHIWKRREGWKSGGTVGLEMKIIKCSVTIPSESEGIPICTDMCSAHDEPKGLSLIVWR